MMSMTGFGRGEFGLDGHSYRIEAKSLNHRFLDVRVRLPWSDAAVETRITTQVRQTLRRGRVEVNILGEDSVSSPLTLNQPLARELGIALQQLADILGCTQDTAARLLPSSI